MNHKQVSIKTELVEKISEQYTKHSTGTNRLLEIALKATTYTEPILKKKFTHQEWVGMADAFNGTIIDPSQPYFRKNVLIGHMEDAETFEGTSQRHGYNSDNLLQKLKELTEFDAMCVMELIYKFWNENKNGERDFNFLKIE